LFRSPSLVNKYDILNRTGDSGCNINSVCHIKVSRTARTLQSETRLYKNNWHYGNI